MAAPNWDVIMDIARMVSMHPGAAKDAVGTVKYKLLETDHQCVLNTLALLQTLMRNCDFSVHQQVLLLLVLVLLSAFFKITKLLFCITHKLFFTNTTRTCPAPAITNNH